MRELQVGEVAGVSTFADRDYVIHGRAERMRRLDGFVDRLAADSAELLGPQDDLFVLLEFGPELAGPVEPRQGLPPRIECKRPKLSMAPASRGRVSSAMVIPNRRTPCRFLTVPLYHVQIPHCSTTFPFFSTTFPLFGVF